MKGKRFFPKRSILFVSVLSLFLIPGFSSGATFCVDNTTGLQTALTTAGSNGEDDTIQIVQRSYSYNGNFTYTSYESNSLTVEGGYAESCSSRVINPVNTVLDGGGTDHVLALVVSDIDTAADFFVEGLTLRNGSASTVVHGGGLYAKTSGEVTLTKNIFTGNISGNNGGGAYIVGIGSLTNNTFTGNSASNNGAGVYISDTGTLTYNTFTNNTASHTGGGAYILGTGILTNNTFTGNAASYQGGGAYGGSSTLTKNTFTSNTANESGGGAYFYNSTLTKNAFTGNTADSYGGGAYLRGVDSQSTLTNNIFSGNSANIGGGVYVYDKKGGSLTNNTITNNTAFSQGGGIFVEFVHIDYTGKLYNNIIWNNTAPQAADLYIDNTGNLPSYPVSVNLFNNDFNQSASGFYITEPFAIDPSNLDGADPLFEGSDDFHLTASSPCINKGDNNAPDLPSTDKDGNPRIVDGTVDIGAYEYNSAATTIRIPIDYPTIQAGIDAASNGATVLVSPGTYVEFIDFKGKAVTVGSLFLTTGNKSYISSTVIDGTNAATTPVIRNTGNASDYTLYGLSIVNAPQTAIRIDSGSPTIKYCNFTDSGTPGIWGAIGIYSNATIENCEFRRNSGRYVVLADVNCSLKISFKNCIFSRNIAAGSWEHNSVILLSSTTIENCLFIENEGNVIGIGGNSNCTSTVINTTIANNKGYGLDFVHWHGVYTFNLYNSIVAFNEPQEIRLTNTLLGPTTTIYNSLIKGGISYLTIPQFYNFNYDNKTNIETDPLFVSIENSDYRLQADSPCIDAGTSVGAPTTDIEGNSRPQGAGYDMGAYEFISSSSPPSVSTDTATSVASGSATLNGIVNPNGASTTVTFEYGTSAGYGSTITATQSPLTGTNSQNVSADVTGLTTSTTYHFRVKGTNSAGATNGDDQTFTTTSGPPVAAPTVTTGSASAVTSTSVALNGTVNPNGSTTTYYFEYGTTASYGASTSSTSAGSGTSDVSANATITGLTSETTYHYRVVAMNSSGTSLGADDSFVTSSLKPSVGVGSGNGTRAGKITLPITLTNISGTDIAAVSVDIEYDTSIFEKPKATIGPSGDTADKTVATSEPAFGVFRVTVFSISNNNIIGNGVVAYLTLNILANAPGIETTLTNTPSASDPSGNDVGVESSDSTVTIIGFLAGDCNGDGTVSIAEVQSAINMYLKIIPVEECVDVNGNGKVSIGEVQKVINNHLDASLASDYTNFDSSSNISREGIVSRLMNAKSNSGVPLLNISNSTGEPGKTVRVSISLANTSGYNISAISCDISYDSSIFEDANVTIGPAGSTAGKTVTSNEISAGVLRIGVLSTSNSNVIEDGVVVYLTFSVKAGASLGQTPLGNSPEASDPSGNDVSIEGSDGVIRIAPAVYVQTSGSCGGNTPCYSSIQAAIDAAETENIIRILQGTFDENIIIDQSYYLILSGGWDSTFTTQTSDTVINSLTIVGTGGTVEIENVVLE